MKADIKQDILRRTILELLEKGSVHYTELTRKYALPGTSLRQQTPLDLNSIIC